MELLTKREAYFSSKMLSFRSHQLKNCESSCVGMRTGVKQDYRVSLRLREKKTNKISLQSHQSLPSDVQTTRNHFHIWTLCKLSYTALRCSLFGAFNRMNLSEKNIKF